MVPSWLDYKVESGGEGKERYLKVVGWVPFWNVKKPELDKSVGVNRSWPELVALISISYQQHVQLDLRIQFTC